MISGALVMVALVGHLHALKRVAGTAVPLPVIALQSLGLALGCAVPAAFMATVDARVHWMSAGIFVMAAITLPTLRPMRRPWGARLISAMMVLSLVFQGPRLVTFALHFHAAAGPIDGVQPTLHVTPLLIDLIVSLLVTTGFMLLLQERLRQRSRSHHVSASAAPDAGARRPAPLPGQAAAQPGGGRTGVMPCGSVDWHP